MKSIFLQNYKHYLREALGLAIFMVSACFFSALFFAPQSPLLPYLPGIVGKNILMGLLMGGTALYIFYSPLTAPSGSHINPAVTLTFWRLDRMCSYDALFFILFQFAGGIIAVLLMQRAMGPLLTHPPVNSAVTVPGSFGITWAFVVEFLIAFITMSMVLFTSERKRLKKYTRIFSACLVCLWVIFAGPVSGFGMNPARSFASAWPAHTWTAFWIYVTSPVAGMMAAAELHLFIQKRNTRRGKRRFVRTVEKTRELLEPLEFLL
jgi:aquaporin Z